ncbi:short-chain dehydrogenase [Pseudooceanicola lipolyticus]|uniref:Short-chain dehydrogenase n=1 Tax=Pseudooceanicola lipolyticus TaxID=2029104 RepID=A0A2M8J5Z9_9RHOB|nr:SDR family NAD(P)-dependent oxidoreductase [Pseudooceanicola lipolyticus]PJE38198.1 short-chain dehydrogenase [Pseudooceanicola lipolyticus]
MSEFANKSYWLIGASEGMGRALARKLSAEGASLILSARSADRLNELAEELPRASVLPFDVTKMDEVRAAVAKVGSVDRVVYNAGAYDPMRATDWQTDAALAICDVNFLGVMRVMGEIVPGMVQAGRGDITLIGSLAGYRGLPAAIGYGASKAAVISLAETMRHDLRGTGVVVRVVNPGFIKTRLTEKNEFRMPMLMSPEEAAQKVLNAMAKQRFRTDFPAPFSWVIRALDYLPDLLVYRGK